MERLHRVTVTRGIFGVNQGVIRMKVVIDLPKCSKEMFDAFNEHLNKYHLSVGDVLEDFIFAMDRSGRLYDRSQDEADLAEGFFNRAVLDGHSIDYEDYQDFKFYGEIFNTEYLKYINEAMERMNRQGAPKSDTNDLTEGQGNHHGGRK